MARRRRIRSPEQHDFESNSYRSGRIYGAHIPIGRGYGVRGTNTNPTNKGANGRMVNLKGEKIDFYIEEIEANFEMAGTTAQSHRKREFYPRNMVQPSVTIRGRAPNSYQMNRLSAFVRVSQYESLRTEALRTAGVPLRHIEDKQGDIVVPTVRLIIRNGSNQGALRGSRYPYQGRTVKGRHQSWVLEGYVKNMPAGARRFDHAPAFEFEFMIAESQQNGANVGIWSDTAVVGNDILPWIDIFKSYGKRGFVRGTPSRADVPDTQREAIEDVGDQISDGIDSLGDFLENIIEDAF